MPGYLTLMLTQAGVLQSSGVCARCLDCEKGAMVDLDYAPTLEVQLYLI